MHNLCCFSVRKQVVNVPSYVVRLDSQKHIDFSLSSPHGCGRPGQSLFVVISKRSIGCLGVKKCLAKILCVKSKLVLAEVS